MSRAAETCARAVAFVESMGDTFSLWCAESLLKRIPVQECVLPGACVQRPDGAFAVSGAPDAPPDLSALLRIIAALDDLRALHLPTVERACGHLEGIQAEDGSWSPGAAASEDDRIFFTGMLAGHFGKTRFARSAMLDAAGDYLAERFSPDRVQNFAWRAIAAYAHCFANVPHEAADAVLQWTGRELERGFRSRQFDAVQTARVLLYCDAPAIPGSRLASAEVVAALLSAQKADGSWLRPGDPSATARVSHTLDALAALVRFG